MPYTLCNDVELAVRVTGGDEMAFQELWHRHWPAARSFAHRFSELIDPDDAVQEAFIKVHDAMRAGKGPGTAFRPYLYRTVHNVAISAGRRIRATPVGDRADLETALPGPHHGEDESLRVLERTVTARAYGALPERWRSVLWYTAVEDMAVQEVAPLLGLTPNATAALARRAREGFKVAWLEAHTRTDGRPLECAWCVERLARFERGLLSAHEDLEMRRHLDSCDACSIVCAQLGDLSKCLKGMLLALALLGSGMFAGALTPGEGATDATTPRRAGGARTRNGSLPGKRQAARALGVAAISSVVLVGLQPASPSDLQASAPHSPARPTSTSTPEVANVPTATNTPTTDAPTDSPGPASEELPSEPAEPPSYADTRIEHVEDQAMGTRAVVREPLGEPPTTTSDEMDRHPDSGAGGTAELGTADPDGAPQVDFERPVDVAPPEDIAPPADDEVSSVVAPQVSIEFGDFTLVGGSLSERVAVPVTLINTGDAAAQDLVLDMPYLDGYYSVESASASDGAVDLDLTIDTSDPRNATISVSSLGASSQLVLRIILAYDARGWADLPELGQWCNWVRPPSTVGVTVRSDTMPALPEQSSTLEIPGLVACIPEP